MPPASTPNTPVRIRPYAGADLDELIALFRNSVRKVARRDYTDEQLRAWAPDEIDRDAWALRLAAASTWVAALSDRAAGFISLEPEGHLDLLYADPDFRGRGIASALLHRLETSARATGLSRLSTDASITARPFFARRGFRLIEARSVVRNGVALATHRMERTLV